MQYSEKLRDPRWQRKRLHIFERDNWKCTVCGDSKATLEIHHLDYLGNDPWDYPDDMLSTLCTKCHGEEQVRPKYEEDLLTALKICNFNAHQILHLATKIHQDVNFRQVLRKILS